VVLRMIHGGDRTWLYFGRRKLCYGNSDTIRWLYHAILEDLKKELFG